ncbi:hypothetical protein EGW08_014246, partial [Elysia chlorotica]
MASPSCLLCLNRCLQSHRTLWSRAKVLKGQVFQQVRHRSILYSAICVERHPIVTSVKSKVEENFSEVLSKIEEENSYLSDHEMRRMKEQRAAKSKQEVAEEDAPGAEAETVTALDLEDKWDSELKTFTAAPRSTPADLSGEQKSLGRKLDASLYLLVKQTVGGREHWVLPQASWAHGETLRQTAERALSSLCVDVQADVLGNAPVAVATYKPPEHDGEQAIKLFFYKAWHRGGDVNTKQGLVSDYAWITKDELKQFCHESYNRHLKKFIF